MTNKQSKIYFYFCLTAILLLASMRSAPVYGKLDFILLNGRPWWTAWKPMVEQILEQGNQPILTDSITSTVLRAVFLQKTVAFRFNYKFSNIDVQDMLHMNNSLRKIIPVGALFLLLNKQSYHDQNVNKGKLKNVQIKSLHELMYDLVKHLGKEETQRKPYRCVINLHGFTPSWVPVETGHWPGWLAHTSAMYRYKGVHGQSLVEIFKKNPPENCMVFF